MNEFEFAIGFILGCVVSSAIMARGWFRHSGKLLVRISELEKSAKNWLIVQCAMESVADTRNVCVLNTDEGKRFGVMYIQSSDGPPRDKSLEDQLHEAIQKEDFERAAKIRDEMTGKS